ncbi:helix-turn-helix transcriptional regulator [Teichococcus oryzae]|uniref:Helix-turn-helix transcriptional regulator n=1 Tax=Teichococcus oryzae TaxID=1608942 RepID=A0A5B2TJK4_9PROT|nr:helix-turn-helix transcriptional regulator [Pseudoroseomonas oryzae]KAA2214165.1 helix-turn-helix transcriptional regulator [Pseudoroseomonas oryzae]
MADPRDLALSLYDAVLQGQPLEQSLAAIARAVQAQTGFISRIGLDQGKPVTATDFTRFQLRQSTLDEYAERWVALDPRSSPTLWSRSGVFNFQRSCPPSVFMNSEYWNEFGRKVEPCVHAMTSIVEENNDIRAALALHRPPDAEPFGDEDEAFLAALFPHLRQALLAQSRLRAVREYGEWLEAGLGAMHQGIALLDGSGRLRHANAALEAMAAQRDGLSLTTEGLMLANRDAMAQARHALEIALAVSAGRIRLLPAGMSFVAPRPSGKPPWLVQMLPLRHAERGRLPGLRGAVAVVTDSAARRTPSAMLLQKLLGLTPAEADLAAALAQGRSIAAQARLRRVSPETLRSHLAAIRRKTGCRRQAELVALVLRLSG